MTKDLWTISLVLLNAFITVSQENNINAEIDEYDQENLQIDAPPGMMMLPQDCFEVCNDYECLYLCPQPLRGVKRCITPLKSNKKSCCQNGQKDPSAGNDKLKTVGKHIWQAREQLLGIKKEIENDLANRRYSLMKGHQPLALRQHNRESFPKLGTKTLKPKSNAVKLICPVMDKKKTDSPNNCVNTNNEALGGAEDKDENHIPQKLPFYENEVSGENENGQLSEYNDEIILSTTMVPVLGNENIENVREQVSAPSPDSHEEIEGKQNSFMDMSGTHTDTLESEHTYDAGFKKSSYYNDCNSPNVDQSNNEELLNQPKPFLSSDTERSYSYNYEDKTPNGGEIETTDQNIFHSDPLIFYSNTDKISPMEVENSVFSQTNRNDLLLTTPSIHAYSSTESHTNTAESIKLVNVNSGDISNYPVTEFQDTTTPGTIGNIRSEKNENILVESNNEYMADDSSAYTGNENFASLTTEEKGKSYIANIEESASSKIDLVGEKISSDSIERILPGSYLGLEEDKHQSPTPNTLSKFDVNFLVNNETCVQNEINQPNKSKNNFYVEKYQMEGSSNKMHDAEYSEDYLNDDASSNANERSQNNIPLSEINSSSGRDELKAEDKNILFETLKLSASSNDQKQNYTYRILQELISKYNITKDLKGGDNNAPKLPLNSFSEHGTSKNHSTQIRPIAKSNLTGQSTNILQNETNENESNLAGNYTTHSQYSSNPITNEMPKFEVENGGKAQSIHVPSNTKINNQLSSVKINESTCSLNYTKNIPVEIHSNILKPNMPNYESVESATVSYTRENTTHGLLKTFPGITKDNMSDTIISDNENETSFENGTASGDRMVINPSHPQVSTTEQDTTGSVYFVQKGSLENTSGNQLFIHPNQLDETIFQIKTNGTHWEMENKDTNINENQYYVKSNIEEPTLENNFDTSNESANDINNTRVVDQELLYDAGHSESSNFNSSEHKLSGAGSIDQELCKETEDNDLHDQTKKVLQLIAKGSEIPSPTTSDDKRTEIKDQGIEEVHLRLEEGNENSSRSFEVDNDYNNLYRPKHSDEISTELNDSEPYTLEDKRDDSNDNKKKLSEIINTELNSLKQQNVILKKREEEEEMSYGDDPQCDCDYATSKDDEPDRYPSSGQYIDRANNYPHPPYPMVIVIPVPYPVCDCENRTSYNSLNNNHINAPEPYVSREHSEHLPDYSINSIYNNAPNGREGKSVRAPPYMPNFFLPIVPWGGMYNMLHPYHQLMHQPYENDLRSQDEMNDKDENLDVTIYNNHPSNGEELKKSNLEDIEESLEDSVATSKRPETQRFSRNERKEIGTAEYVFVDGQYVKVFKADKNEGNEDEDTTEQTPTTVAPTSIAHTSTTALYISTNQEPLPVVNSAALDTNNNGQRPVHYFYPNDFGGAQNNFFGGRQHVFAERNETNVSKTFFMDFKENSITEEPKKDHYIGKNENTNNASTVRTYSTWPSFADLLNQMNSTKTHHYKHHHKHRWWLHISHHLEKMKAKVRLKNNDTKRWQEERFQNFVFRKEKVSDVSIPILVISDKKQYRKREKSEISVQTEYTPRKIRHET